MPGRRPSRDFGQETTTSSAAASGFEEAVLTRGLTRSMNNQHALLKEELDQIVNATYRVICETGKLDPSMRDILREAGLSTPAFYRHFQSKDELLLGLLERGWATLSAYLTHQMDQEPSADAQIAAWIRGMMAQAADPDAARRARPFVANLNRIAAAYPAEHQRARTGVIRSLADPISRLRLRSLTDVWPDAIATYDLVSAAQGRHMLDETTPTNDETKHLVDYVLAALAR